MPMKAIRVLRYSRGLTLVELMTALVISLVLLAGVAQVFVANKQTYQFSQSFARNQENARFSVNVLTRALRTAGYLGCQPDYVQNFLVGGGTGFSWTDGQSIEGYDGGSVPSSLTGKLPSGVSVVSGADAFTLHAISGTGLRLQADMSDATDDLTIPTDNGLSQFDIVMVADCEKGAIFQITNSDPDSTGLLSHIAPGGGTPGNTVAKLNKAYGKEAELVRLTEVSYLLGNKKVDVDGDGTADDVPTLYRYRGGSTRAEELVEGIEDLQIRYGIANDPNDPGTASKYLSAASVAADEWDDVVAVEVRALVASLRGGLLDVDQDITFNGSPVDTSDRKVRQAVNVIVGVRNAIR